MCCRNGAQTTKNVKGVREMKLLLSMTDSRRKISLLFILSFLAMC